MADTNKGGKKGRKIGRNSRKYGNANCEHKFTDSKEHRGCGPLGYYMKKVREDMERERRR